MCIRDSLTDTQKRSSKGLVPKMRLAERTVQNHTPQIESRLEAERSACSLRLEHVSAQESRGSRCRCGT
eukprot:9235813-Prorocentrum_lima.AAC.1